MERAATWATAGFGVIVLMLFGAFALQPEMQAAAQCLPAGSVVQFELASSRAELAAIFGAADSACRPLAVAAMDAVNHLDILAFIPAYTAFCIAAALFLAGDGLRLLAIAAIAAALGAAAGDYVETTTLLALTQSLDQPDHLLPRLQAGAWSKFALLAAHAFLCAGLCFNSAKRRTILGALLLLPAIGTAIAALDHTHLAGVMNAGFTVAWTAILIAAIRDAFMRKAAA